MRQIQAVLWDVDGTLAETERDGHRVAFNRAFEEHGLPWRWDEAGYGQLLRVTGGRERILHDMRSRADAPATADEREALARSLHQRKNAIYGDMVRSARLPLRAGVAELMNDCRQAGMRMAIVTTTSAVNVEALLGVHFGPRWRTQFAAVVCGEDVQHKKPDPEAYRLALQRLKLAPLQCVAIEDSPGGVASARGADIPVVVPLSAYFASATLEGAVAIGPGLHTRQGWRPPARAAAAPAARVTLDDLLAWCAERDTVSQYG
jgi:HAD superfamily hydrolase (TIGR01509 family)